MKIWANCIVHNEENFIWFAIMSVVDYVDKVLVWDTGSTDKTVEIIREIRRVKGNKIDFKEVGPVDKFQFTKMRQQMLDQSQCDWILILDGDEIWWQDSIKRIINKIKENGEKLGGIVVPMMMPVGDIYHLQEEAAGQYKLLGRKGHFSLRAINRKIPGLHVDWPYGKESFFDSNGLIQKRDDIVFVDAPYLHTTHLRRSGIKRRPDKYKYELGNKVPEHFRFPEVFYRPYPAVVPSPWKKIAGSDLVAATILTPIRKLKRRLI